MKQIIVADIDGTQLREDVHKHAYNAEDLSLAGKLKTQLESLADQGHIIVHATNRMAELVLEDVGTLLAVPHYVTCSSSTRILKVDRVNGTIEDDADYDALVESCNFDAATCQQQAGDFPELVMTEAINQTPRKVSYTFQEGTPVERRLEIQSALQEQQPAGIKIFMVEDRDNHIIDFLPAFCTKQEVVNFILKKENVAPENVIAFGNSNNDIPLLRHDFRGVAVGDSRPSLISYVQELQKDGTDNHVIAPEPSTRGVLWGLRHFGLTA